MACQYCQEAAEMEHTPAPHDCPFAGHPFLPLLGCRILGVFLPSGEGGIAFRLKDRWLYAETDAPCCSDTWIADLIGVTQLLTGVVTSVEDLVVSGPETDARSRQNSDQYYGIQIGTTAGSCDIIYRNSSNGCYGGSMRDLNEVAQEALPPLREIRDDYPG